MALCEKMRRVEDLDLVFEPEDPHRRSPARNRAFEGMPRAFRFLREQSSLGIPAPFNVFQLPFGNRFPLLDVLERLD